MTASSRYQVRSYGSDYYGHLSHGNLTGQLAGNMELVKLVFKLYACGCHKKEKESFHSMDWDNGKTFSISLTIVPSSLG